MQQQLEPQLVDLVDRDEQQLVVRGWVGLQHLLTHYSLERLLYRLSQSPHRDAFVLKGAMLFGLWSKQRHRPTKDLDLLGKGEISVAQFEQVFREICKQPVPDDGLLFKPETVNAEPIREEEEYKGLRIQFMAMLGNARIPIQVDIGSGNVITPEVIPLHAPYCASFLHQCLRSILGETVVAGRS